MVLDYECFECRFEILGLHSHSLRLVARLVLFAECDRCSLDCWLQVASRDKGVTFGVRYLLSETLLKLVNLVSSSTQKKLSLSNDPLIHQVFYRRLLGLQLRLRWHLSVFMARFGLVYCTANARFITNFSDFLLHLLCLCGDINLHLKLAKTDDLRSLLLEAWIFWGQLF